MPSQLLQGKKILILGLANQKSIAYGIAKTAHDHGAELYFTYQNEQLLKRIEPIAAELSATIIGECDVTTAQSLENLSAHVSAKNIKFDGLVHAIAFSDKNELSGRYMDTTLPNFLSTMHISCFSFTDILRRLEPHLNQGASAITLSYYGAEKVMPNYNVMGVAKAALEASVKYLANDLGPQGIRVNAISAGPIKTLAASGISDFRAILHWNAGNTPLRKTVSTEEVGGSALYLLSDLSTGVTGETHHVDAGYHTIGMGNPEFLKDILK